MRRREHLGPAVNRSTRSAALLATAVALPVVLVVAFLVGETSGSGDGAAGPASPSSSAAPGPLSTTVPAPAADVQAVCDPVLAAMPVTLDPGDGSKPLQPVKVVPGGPTFLAWGNPLVTLQCGVDRPSWLRDDIDYGRPQQITAPDGAGALWVAEQSGDRVTWTVIDRAVYLRAVVPVGEPGYVTDFSSVIGKLLPPVCSTPQPGDGPDTVYCGARP